MRNQEEMPPSLAPDLIDAIWSMRSLGIVIYRATGRILDANDRFARLLGYTIHELRQLNVDEVVHPDVRRRYDAPSADPRGVEARRTRIEPKLLHRNGHPIWVRIHKSSIVIDGERCVLVCIDDWTTHHDRLTAIEYDADHDRLTGVQNRRGMLRTVESRLLDGPQTALAVELSGLREINDLRGYAAGDIVLREVATQLATAAGDDARVARLYGAEFIVLTDPGDAPATTRRIHECIEGGLEADPHGLVTLSVAIAGVCSRPGMSAGDLLTAAEAKLHAAHV